MCAFKQAMNDHTDSVFHVQQMSERVTPDEFKAMYNLVVESLKQGLTYEQFALKMMDAGVQGMLSSVDLAHP